MEINLEIAAAMGFSSFGNQLSNKKRKFNPDDAFVDTSNTNSSSTGANSMQLGVRRKEILNISALHSSQLGGNGGIDGKANPGVKGKQKQSGPSGLVQFLARGEALKQDVLASENGGFGMKNITTSPPSASSLPNKSTPSIPSIPPGNTGRDDMHALRKGVRNVQGDVAYFLPSFVEDPWEGQRKGGK
ncbi:hypothetical protein AOQ84DRAFT_281925 [Glonium stellatum]|uniref:Uncharacterized protein n=1 Tax=Glonium stellatum TaxID=574774 RepID=A0A8E2FBD4_9PEZI|nr:hypothetical protein AOQ84DRAFT_281925 [Glonium stellatum]